MIQNASFEMLSEKNLSGELYNHGVYATPLVPDIIWLSVLLPCARSTLPPHSEALHLISWTPPLGSC